MIDKNVYNDILFDDFFDENDNKKVMRYSLGKIMDCWKETKNEYQQAVLQDSEYSSVKDLLYCDDFNFSLKDHEKEYTKLKEMIERFDKQLGNYQMYPCTCKLHEYERDLKGVIKENNKINKNNKLNKETKNMLNHDLWLVFSSIKEVLNSLRQYENEITLKAIAKLE
jgi:hypothetical protein